MKIAIIGTGISGLGAAWLLNKSYDITMYEQNNYIGGHANTIDIIYNNKNISVDTGFIVYNEVNYPNLVSIFKKLDVKTIKSNMSFGVTINNGEIEYSGANITSIFAQKSNLLKIQFWQMLYGILKFNSAALNFIDDGQNLTLGQYLAQQKLSESFKFHYLLPMASAIWSSDIEDILNYPVKTFIKFFENHGLLRITNQLQWYSVQNGSKEYIKKFTKDFADRIVLNCKIKKIIRSANNVKIVDSNGIENTFDHVVIASHADQAIEMLDKPSNLEQELLSKFKYQNNLAILHKDLKVMPKRLNAWASWVYKMKINKDKTSSSITYWMNLLQSIDKNFPLFVTLNPIDHIAQKNIFATINYRHPIFDQEAIEAQENLNKIQGINRTWFCGSYHKYGFHEDGLSSGLRVANMLGLKTPW